MSKKRLWKVIASFVLMGVVYTGAFVLHEYRDRHNCLCTVLTEEPTRHLINEKLLDVYEDASEASGVFIQASMPCEHGVNLHLTIYPDEGYFNGYRDAK